MNMKFYSLIKLWIHTHYEYYEDGIVNRSVMYTNYKTYCKEQQNGNGDLMEKGIFDWIINKLLMSKTYAKTSIRRLGKRNLYGIRVKDSIPHLPPTSQTTTTTTIKRLGRY